jgi:hypothetical protein
LDFVGAILSILSSRHKKNAEQVKEKARRRGGATQLSVFSHHASH